MTTTRNSTMRQTPLSRPLLIFKHNPKAGGGSIIKLLNEVKPISYFRKELVEESVMNLEKVNESDSFIIIRESESVYEVDHNVGYVISSIREPCDHYVSLWSFGSSGHGDVYYGFKKRRPDWTLQAYGKDPPTFHSSRDIYAFQSIWLRDEEVLGLIARRHMRSFFGQLDSMVNVTNTRRENDLYDDMLKNVDCWVYVDDFQATLYKCLWEYEAQGGKVNWKAPLLYELIQDLNKKNRFDSDQRRRIQTIATNYSSKNEVLGNPQLSHHSKCSEYFDKNTSDLVRYGAEAFIYDMYEYEGCCGGRKNKMSLVLQYPKSYDHNHQNEWNAISSHQNHEHEAKILIFYAVLTGVVGLIISIRKCCKQQQASKNEAKYEVVSQVIL